jgi:hypothetical protein
MVVKVNGKPLEPQVGTEASGSEASGSEESVSRAAAPTPPVRRRNRKRTYDVHKVTAEVFALMGRGVMVTEALQNEGMPGHSQFYEWLDADPALAKAYAKAQRVQEQVWADQVVTLVDTVALGDMQVTEKLPRGKVKVTGVRMADKLAKAKAQADNRKWLLARRDPARYAPQQVVTGGGNTTTNISGNGVVEYRVINSPDAEPVGPIRDPLTGLTLEESIARNRRPGEDDDKPNTEGVDLTRVVDLPYREDEVLDDEDDEGVPIALP